MKSNPFKILTLSIFIVLLFSISISPVFAQNLSGNNIVLESGETLEKTSFLSGNNIRIDGDINGSAFVAASNVEINGDIDGDLFVAAQSIVINGTVKGSVFTASQNVAVNGNVENNIYSAGNTLNIKSKADGSAFLVGQNIYVEEEAIIEKDVFIGGANVYHNGVINSDLNSSSESISVHGLIAGDLNYQSQEEVNLSTDAEIEGNINWTEIKPQPAETKTTSYASKLFGALFSILAALVVWLVIRLLRRTFWVNIAENILHGPLKTFGFGALAFILVPFIVLLIMITIIGIPLSLILLAFYLISLYVAKIIVSVSIAYWFQEKFGWSNAKIFWLFLLSLIVLSLLVVVPYLGWLIRFIIVSFGLGAILLSLKREPKIVIPENQNFN